MKRSRSPTGRFVGQFAQYIEMACVPYGFLDHVHKRPAHRGRLRTFGVTGHRGLQVVTRVDDMIRVGDGVPVGGDEAGRGFAAGVRTDRSGTPSTLPTTDCLR